MVEQQARREARDTVPDETAGRPVHGGVPRHQPPQQRPAAIRPAQVVHGPLSLYVLAGACLAAERERDRGGARAGQPAACSSAVAALAGSSRRLTTSSSSCWKSASSR